MYFDTHAHYDSGAFNADWKELLASMPQKGVELIVNPGCDLESSRTAVALADGISPCLRRGGGPPLRLRRMGEGTLLELRQLASRPKVRAIGEIGLDYYWKDNPPPGSPAERVPPPTRRLAARPSACPLSSTTGRPTRTASPSCGSIPQVTGV